MNLTSKGCSHRSFAVKYDWVNNTVLRSSWDVFKGEIMGDHRQKRIEEIAAEITGPIVQAIITAGGTGSEWTSFRYSASPSSRRSRQNHL